MKELRSKIMDYLMKIPSMDKNYMETILLQLETKKQAQEMLIYLQQNESNKELMRVDRLMKKAVQIGS